MKLAVQVITYKSSGHLRSLLESLRAQTFRDFELFVLDNSVDAQESSASRALVEAAGLRQHFITNEKNSGFSGGHTRLYAMHDAPYVMLLNDDATLEPRYLEAVMRRIESDEKIGSVTGLVYRPDGHEVDTSGLEYKSLAQITDRHTAPAETGQIFGVSGAVGLYRRSAVEKAGGLFQPSWFMYKEDVDLALRLREAGFTSWYEPAAVAHHKRGLKEEGSGLLGKFFAYRRRPALLRRYSYVNQWRLYRRHWKLIDTNDRRRSIKAELKRSLAVLFLSPVVFFLSWYDIARA